MKIHLDERSADLNFLVKLEDDLQFEPIGRVLIGYAFRIEASHAWVKLRTRVGVFDFDVLEGTWFHNGILLRCSARHLKPRMAMANAAAIYNMRSRS